MARTLVLHFHELWLKGGNRNFFLGKLLAAVRQSLEPLPHQASIVHSRILVDLQEEATVEIAVERLRRVFGLVYFAVVRRVKANPEQICTAAWEEVAGRAFESFAVRVKRGDKSFPMGTSELERLVGQYLLDRLRAAGHRGAHVNLGSPGADLLCGNHRRFRAGLQREATRSGRHAGQHRRSFSVLAFGWLRFGGGRLQNDEAWRARGVCPLPRAARTAGGIFCPGGPGAGGAFNPVSVYGPPLSGALRAHPAANRGARRRSPIASCSTAA